VFDSNSVETGSASAPTAVLVAGKALIKLERLGTQGGVAVASNLVDERVSSNGVLSRAGSIGVATLQRQLRYGNQQY